MRDSGLSALTVLPSLVDALVVGASRSRTAEVGSCTRLKASRYRTLLCAEISRKGYSLHSSDRYPLWLATRRERRPRPVARKSASVSIWGVRTACVTSR